MIEVRGAVSSGRSPSRPVIPGTSCGDARVSWGVRSVRPASTPGSPTVTIAPSPGRITFAISRISHLISSRFSLREGQAIPRS